MSEPTHTTDNDTDEEIAPRPRTLRRAAAAEAPAAPVAAAPEAPEPPLPATTVPDDSERRAAPVAPIHGGWTAGPQVMDATATWAQRSVGGEDPDHQDAG